MLEFHDWYRTKQRVLPWRSEPTPYRVWISEIMLQQTQVVTVIPYFEKFISRFPTVEELARAPSEEVMIHWAGLGYYSRARNLHKGAQKILELGRFPQSRDEWITIPGVGPYTAGAISSISLNQAEAILDGNVERVWSRLFRMNRAGGDAVYRNRLWGLSGRSVRWAAHVGMPPREFNQALMELGATVCTPRKPKCAECPLVSLCRANQEGDAEAYPPRKAPKEWVRVQERDVWIRRPDGRVLVEKRAPGEWRAGLWDLPRAAPVSGLAAVGEVVSKHVVTRHKITRTTHVYSLKKDSWQAAEGGVSEYRWINPEEPEVALGSAFRRVYRAVSALTQPKSDSARD